MVYTTDIDLLAEAAMIYCQTGKRVLGYFSWILLKR